MPDEGYRIDVFLRLGNCFCCNNSVNNGSVPFSFLGKWFLISATKDENLVTWVLFCCVGIAFSASENGGIWITIKDSHPFACLLLCLLSLIEKCNIFFFSYLHIFASSILFYFLFYTSISHFFW